MFFYFLGVVLALVTIFGLVHSPAASEHLQLQNFCVWSSSTVRRRLQEYNNLFGIQDNDGGEIVDIVEITVTQAEAPSSEPPETLNASETIEEIDGIRLNETIEKIEEDVRPEAEEGAVYRINEEANETPSSSTPTEARATESRDSVLSAINASLRRLSSAANSGRINGVQLYQILLRETLLHEKSATKAEDAAAAELSSAHSSSTVILGAVSEDEANDGKDSAEQPKAKLYFGDAAIEYVPHQK